MSDLVDLLTKKPTSVRLRRAAPCRPLPKWARMYARMDSFFDMGFIDLPKIKEICIRENIIENKAEDINYLRRYFRISCKRRQIHLLPYEDRGRTSIPFYLRKKIYEIIAAELERKTSWKDILEILATRKDLHIDKARAYRVLLWWRELHNIRGKFFIAKCIKTRRKQK